MQGLQGEPGTTAGGGGAHLRRGGGRASCRDSGSGGDITRFQLALCLVRGGMGGNGSMAGSEAVVPGQPVEAGGRTTQGALEGGSPLQEAARVIRRGGGGGGKQPLLKLAPKIGEPGGGTDRCAAMWWARCRRCALAQAATPARHRETQGPGLAF
ncbi:hypothetical protein PLESTF_001606500 [Pleodorina starrii]|nr:hypothetical protein PLESTF_001606500 [Pleodorina starrii]